jgi:hypothetical protein
MHNVKKTCAVYHVKKKCAGAAMGIALVLSVYSPFALVNVLMLAANNDELALAATLTGIPMEIIVH